MLSPRPDRATVAAAVLLAATPALAQINTTISLTPAADTFVCGAPSRVDQNFGASGALSFAPSASPKGESSAILRFNLAGLAAQLDAVYGPGNWSFQSIGLRLTAVAPLNSIFNSTAPGDFDATWIADDSWVEGSGTPNAPALTGLTFNTLSNHLSPDDRTLGSFPFAGTLGQFTAPFVLDVDFLADVLAGGPVSIRLHSRGATATFNSRNFTATPAQQPVLALAATGPCRPDLTLGTIPGQPGYGQPNGTLNNDDFFYYLAQFAAGNAAAADMTTTAIPGTPGYGLPNGVINNDDFFFYLVRFDAGC